MFHAGLLLASGLWDGPSTWMSSFCLAYTQDPFLDPKTQLDIHLDSPAGPWCPATICPITPRIIEVKLVPSPWGLS